jgi:hypothetical protein
MGEKSNWHLGPCPVRSRAIIENGVDEYGDFGSPRAVVSIYISASKESDAASDEHV